MQARNRAGRYHRVCVIKIGGSVITDKRTFKLNYAIANSIAEEIAAAVNNGIKVGIVLGGGSYGHVASSNARVLDAPPADALTLVTMYMFELALAMADILASKGVKPVVYPPHSFCDPNGLVPRCNWNSVLRDMKVGVTPLVYGDVYACGENWCIVSGDELAIEMACSLGSPLVVYVTDVDGVIGTDGKVIDEILVDELEESSIVEQKTANKIDVTGGIKRKLDAIRANRCPTLREILVINGLREGNTYAALMGHGSGTRIIL
ncbi:MAG TPA: hypothetical protein EYH50_01765 [Pyrodictium delaneyi]|uniref:Isopentenyl phosphate kinase n=1 Tax=Pyrodictium delaneyi TaxID=1273541 RepID=A0A833E8I4_9CREN|nr:hypothetical protein [Pyrodictium delaneyi]